VYPDNPNSEMCHPRCVYIQDVPGGKDLNSG